MAKTPIDQMTYREFNIKKKNGKVRRICAPSKSLLQYQRRLLPTFVENFKLTEYHMFGRPVFHGFVPNRNCVTAARQHIGFSHTISLDVSNCFDSIYIAEIPGVPNNSQLAHKDGTLAQGFATSPILACTYMLDPLKEVDTLLQGYFDSPDDYALTMYADDIQISVRSTTDFDTLNMLVDFITVIFSNYKLTINKTKTRMHHAKYGNRRILGIQVGQTTIAPNRRLRKKMRAAAHQGNYRSLGGLTTASRLLLPKALR